MNIEKYRLTNLLNDEVYCETWKPKNEIKAILLLVHGLGEHCNRYRDDFANFFTSNGIAIYTFDLPGHGQSGGKRGHIRHFSDPNKIILTLLEKIKRNHPDCPVYIYGHSLGGLISAAFLLESQPDIKGAILSAPAIDIDNPLPPFKVLIAKIMNKIYPSLALDNGLKREFLSKNQSVIEKYNKDPLVHGLATARLGTFIINKGKYVINNPDLLSISTLIMVGEDEKIVSKHAITVFCNNSNHCELKIWDDMYHEIHNEDNKKSVFRYVLSWMSS